MFKVDQKFAEFELETYDPRKGDVVKIKTHDFKGKFLVLFFYPADFTFVCPTELADLERRHAEFEKAGAEVVVVSTDTVFTHKAWIETEQLLKDIKFLMAADHNGKLSKELGIYDEDSGLAQRAAFIVDPQGILRAVDITADNIGRSAGEILRKVKALAFVESHKGMACPASWDEGSVALTPSIKISGKVAAELEKGNK
jgi:peroxiredoxin (alkyl hydroperoxide reductase subunit C)